MAAQAPQAPPMPHLTPEQMQRATAYLPVEQVLMVAAYLSPEMLQYQINHIDDNRAPEIITSAVIIGVLAIAAVVLRLYCRRTMKVAFSYDDYLIIMGLVGSILGREYDELETDSPKGLLTRTLLPANLQYVGVVLTRCITCPPLKNHFV